MPVTTTYNPKAEVTLTKVVRRTGPDRLNKEISDLDLTQWFGENGSIIVHQERGQPGTFSITLADRMNPSTEDTLYSLLEPMDVITIRMARQPHQYNRLPVVMRGFIHEVKRVEEMSPDGKPVRAVKISGWDIAGTALQRVEIFHKGEYVLGNALLTEFPLFEILRVQDYHTAGDFVRHVVEVANAWLSDLSMRAWLDVPLRIQVDADLVTKGKVGPFAIQAFQGNLWAFLMNWCDLGWNELLLEDRPDGPWLVYRPKPYRGVDGKPTSLDPSMSNFRPAEIELDASQVVSMELRRSPDHAANFFHVRAPQAEWVFGELLRSHYLQNGSTFTGDDFPNSALSTYGLMKLEETSGHYSDEYLAHPDKLRGEAKEEQAGFENLWIDRRREELKRQAADGVVFEDGSMRVQGWETLRPGMNMVLNRGALRASYYLHAVTHEFRGFHSYTCGLQVLRGTGFIERMKMSGSPYHAEMAHVR
jgi:hypothetical protein